MPPELPGHIIAKLTATAEASGVPVRVTDPVVLDQVARLLLGGGR